GAPAGGAAADQRGLAASLRRPPRRRDRMRTDLPRDARDATLPSLRRRRPEHPRRRRRLLLAGVIAVAVARPLPAVDPRLAITQLARQVWQDELPQNTVLTILQTRDGYLWLGTYEGLA